MNELDVLIELARHQPKNIQNASQTMLADLQQRGLVKDDLTLTEAGYAYLEPYRVKRAVLIAAGFGSRMVPLTYTTPKPLIKVHGRRIIETLLDALLAAGIKEIIICRGYLKETFDVLKDKYPMIQFVENPIMLPAIISAVSITAVIICLRLIFWSRICFYIILI